MIRFNTILIDPYVSVLFHEMSIIDFLADSGKDARQILKHMEAGVKAPDRPTNLIYVNFFFDSVKKVLFLILADDKPLKLKFADGSVHSNKEGIDKKTRMVLISASSSKALMQYFSECVRSDHDNRAVYYNVQSYLHGQYRKNMIPVE